VTGDPNLPTPTTTTPSSGDDAGLFSQAWADSLSQVFGQITSASLAVENLAEMPSEVPPPDPADVQMIVIAAGALRGEMSLRIPKVAALGMARSFLGEPQDAAAELKPDHSPALEELLRQVAGHAATAVKARWGEVQFQVQIASPPSWAAGAGGWWSSKGATPCPVWAEWKLSAALHAALAAAAPSKPDAPAGADAPNSAALPSRSSGDNLDLLMDVALEVMLRFGERTLLLREILELGAGSVVELNRKIGDPADLLLDGKVVARGEVVVVDGNYGLRVLEIVSPAIGVLRGKP
jgi:flagellar motor switch protein FliN